MSTHLQHILKAILAFHCILPIATRAVAANYTNDTNWGGGNWTLAAGDVVGGVHTNVGHLSIPGGATVTVQPYVTDTSRFGRVTIFAGSAGIQGALSADEAGYPETQGDGAGTSQSGAAYGGRGGRGNAGTAGDTYGSADSPDQLGSGGGDNNGTGGTGGGALLLDVAGTLTVDGTVSSKGGDGSGRAGGGSGGSVWLRAGTIEGGGVIAADGGAGGTIGTYGAGGGGGRIAFDTDNNNFAGIIRAQGQPGHRAPGHSGTFNFQTNAAADLVISNDIALPPGTNWIFNSLVVTNGAVFEIQSIPGTAGESYTNDVASRVRFEGDVTVTTNSSIRADGLGHIEEQGQGGAYDRCGGGYGGRGGIGRNGYAGDSYGSADTPNRLGSGGGDDTSGYSGGSGGGAVILDVGGTLTVDGTVSAHGENANYRSGGGSGGSIWLTAGTIEGAGTIAADGGEVDQTTYAGGGGGGRIALDSDNNNFAGIIRAQGMDSFHAPGRSGTFNFQTNAAADLIISNDIALPPGTNWIFNSLLVTNGAAFEIQSVPGTAAQSYTNDVASRVRFEGDVTVASDASIQADGLGYLHEQGQGGAYDRCGAGYGGRGGIGSHGYPGYSYGSADAPDRLGSGGGRDAAAYNGGPGGGAVIMDVAGTLTVAGTVSAQGDNGNYRSGGGSGGSIWLTAGTLEGAGMILADGGDTEQTTLGAGGGGGRIALDVGTDSFTGIIRAMGISGSRDTGRSGTFNFQTNATTDLVIEHDIALAPGTNWIFRSILVTNGATFEIQSVPGTVAEGYTNDVASRVRFAEDVTVASNAAISADGLGHIHEQGEGAGTDRCGGGYGGVGGLGTGGTPGGTYGSADTPDRLGSGGGRDASSYAGGPGGGVIILDVGGLVTVQGTLSANGGNANYRSGGGSGGSVWLTAREIEGSGTIAADGGVADDAAQGGGGGGGRIALDTETNNFDGAVSVLGMPGAVSDGGPGTVKTETGEDTDLVIDGPYSLPADTNWVFASITVEPGGILEIKSTAGTAESNYTDEVASRIRVIGDVTVKTNGVISADAQGYAETEGPGAGFEYCGGAYGGRGGRGGTGIPGDTYGSAYAPDRLGSGGGKYSSYAAGAGGGAVILDVGGALTVDGTVSAQGGDASSRCGGGSGGSVWLTAHNIEGIGLITADGGSYDEVSFGGGGGGGRIALDTDTNNFTGTIRAQGKPGRHEPGRNGTLNFQSNASTDLVVTADIALPPGTNWQFRSLLVTNGASFEIQSIPGTAATNYSDEIASRVRFEGDVTVASNATIRADGLGYLEQQGDGAGDQYCGGAYGGRGGVGNLGTPGEPYGSAYAPDRLGSGGGKYSDDNGGSGGGAVILDIAGVLTVDGTVSADGGEANSRCGGGSGGSVWLTASAIGGDGVISSDGGSYDVGDQGGGGAGGRIALDTDTNNFAGVIRAEGGAASRDPGRSGTLNFSSDPTADLVIPGDIAIPPGTNWEFRSLVVTNGATFEIQSTPGTAATNYSDEVASRIQFMDDVSVASNAAISADGLGYSETQGDGAGDDYSGGGYGGRGGEGTIGLPSGTYGSAYAPDRLGSGGGKYSDDHGGFGAGAVILDVGGDLIVDGSVTANGGDANSRCGGGSGGSVWLTAHRIAGAGTIAADGGRYHDTASGSGGGGGRIALDTDTNDFAGTIRAQGMPGKREPGRSGTLNFESDPAEDLVIVADIALPPRTNWVFASLLVTNGATFEVQSLQGTSAGSYTDEVPTRLTFLGNVTVASNATLSASGLGYLSGEGEGVSTIYSGAGYGGIGGLGSSGTAGGTYGAADEADRLGSAAALYLSYPGGPGGGAVFVDVANILTVDGTVSANGAEGVDRGGGGSGGSLQLSAPRIRGYGTLSANGGKGASATLSGGGGGGRILIDFGWVGADKRPPQIEESWLNPASWPDDLEFTGTASVDGGSGLNDGDPGTIMLRYRIAPGGTLIMIR